MPWEPHYTECVLEAYFSIYNIIHRRFKTASIIRGFLDSR